MVEAPVPLEPAPCDFCEVNPATRELMSGAKVCTDCYATLADRTYDQEVERQRRANG